MAFYIVFVMGSGQKDIMTDEYYKNKLNNQIDFTESDFWDFIDGYGIKTEYGDLRRWYRSATTICEFNGKYYACEWDQGLTENQENQWYGDQPYEVVPKDIVVTKVERIWERV